MTSKSDQIRAKLAAGDHLGALRIAAKFFDRSPDTKTFKSGWDATQNPSFYRQIGKDPGNMQAEAITLLTARFMG